MRAGALRQRLQLQAPVSAADGMGGSTTTWTPVTTLWGQVDPATGGERLLAEQITAVITHEIVIRYRTGVVPKMRLVRQQAGSQTFEIHAVLNLEDRNKQLTLLCSEVQLQGA